MRAKYFCLLAGLVLGGFAHAQQWFLLAGRDSDFAGTRVEVDLESVKLRDGNGEGVIRVTHDVLQAHRGGFGYRSFVATIQLDCQQRNVSLTSAAYFAQPAGNGMRVGADSTGREAGMPARLLQTIPQAARGALLRATCGPAAAR